MQFQKQIEGQDVDVWTDGGTVEAINLRSQTQVWTEGGGGYVGPNGGYVNAPQLRLNTTELKEVRFLSDDASRRTVSVAGEVAVMPGDRVAFVYAGETAQQMGRLIGFVNFTEGRWWGFTQHRLIREAGRFKRLGILALIGVVIAFVWCSFRISSVHNGTADEGWSLLLFFFIYPTAVILFHAFAAAEFDHVINEALRNEVAAICKAGDRARPRPIHPNEISTPSAKPRVAV